LVPGSKLLVKHGARTVQALVQEITARFDEQTLSSVDGPDSLELNDIGRVILRTSEEIPVDDYGTSPRTGAFLVIDPKDGDTLAAGMVGERFA
jgi:sulfate adenylyltransferase subunit 1